MEKGYLSISQVNTYIKNIFEAEIMLQNISVYGEISSYNISNGIAYFNLKDENNLLPCVLFSAHRFEAPNIGDQVLVTGSISYYAKGGRLSFQANSIAPYGKGLLYEKFVELKNKLERLGYFALERKKPLPKRVTKIGVVTSATGAVIQDIIDVSTRRNDGVSIVLFPVKVQGVGAEFEIAKGIEFFSNYTEVDCVIVARGGGSMEDLQPFNTEVVANAAYACKKPLVSAVGHETDFTIIDFVSDLRAPTPSAAAELVVNSKLDDYNTIVNQISHIEKSLNAAHKKYQYGIQNSISKMQNALEHKLVHGKNCVNNVLTKMQYQVQNKVSNFENQINLLHHTLVKFNPLAMLEKGYTKLERNGVVLKSIAGVKQGDLLSVRLKDGSIGSTVTEIRKGEFS